MKKKQLTEKRLSVFEQCINKIHHNDIGGLELLLNGLTPAMKMNLFSTTLTATIQYNNGKISVQKKICHRLLSYIISQKNLEAARLVLQHNAPVDYRINDVGLHGQDMTLFFFALHWGSAEIALELLNRSELDVNTGGKDNEERATTAFAFACTRFPQVARKMLKHTGLKLNDIFEVNKDNVILPLIRAVAAGINKTSGSVALINDLLDLYRKENKPIPMSAFYLACEESSGMLFSLFQRFGVSVTQTENYHKMEYITKVSTYNAVSIACSQLVSNSTLLKMLLEKYGDDPTVINIKAREILDLGASTGVYSAEISGLMRATLRGDLEKVKLLIEKGANIFDTAELIPVQDDDLSDCEKQDYAPMLARSKRIKKTNQSRTVIEFAFESENQELLAYVLEHAIATATAVEPEKKQFHFHCGLVMAMKYKTGIEYFSDYLNIPFKQIQANVGERAASPPLPLCYAIAKKMDMRIIVKLIDAGAKINPANDEEPRELSTYPLAIALTTGNIEAVNYLIEQKVDPTIPLLFSDQVMSIIVYICIYQRSLSIFLRKILELWKNDFSHKKIPGPCPLEVCVSHGSAESLSILLSYKNSLFKESAYLKDQKKSFNKLLCFFSDRTAILKALLGEGCFADIKFLDEEKQFTVLLACMLSNKEEFFKTYLKYHPTMYANGKEILEEGFLGVFLVACFLYKKNRVYLDKLIEKYLALEHPDFDRVGHSTLSPTEIAIFTRDAQLLSKLLKHGFVLTPDLIDLIHESKSPGIIAVALTQLPSTADKKIFKDVFALIGYQYEREPKKHMVSSNLLTEEEIYSYHDNLLKECIKNITTLNEEKKIQGLHFLLFRFYETLCQSHFHYRQHKIGKNPDIILSFEDTKNMRNALAHQYEMLTAEDYKRFATSTVSLYERRALLENKSEPGFSPFQWLLDGLSQCSLCCSLIERVNILHEQFIKNQSIFQGLTVEERFSPDKSLLFSIQECIWLIGENYQQINMVLKQKLGFDDPKYKQNIWNDTQGMELWHLMESSLYVRNALSHTVKDEPLSDSFNEHYLVWLGEQLSQATERFEPVLNQVKGYADSHHYLNM